MRWTAGLLLLFTVAASQADILYLRDGSRYYGDLIQQNSEQVVFRVMQDERAGMVRRFQARHVLRVERSARRVPEAPVFERARTKLDDQDYEQIYREALELAADGEVKPALLALQRLVSITPDDLLIQIDHAAAGNQGESVAELMARLRMTQAAANRDGVFELRFATRFEAPALVAQLIRLHDTLLERVYHERLLRDWIAEPEAYAQLQPDARRMVRDLRTLAGVLGARVRHDRDLAREPLERGKLVRLRDSVARLTAWIEARPGYTSLGSGPALDDPTAITARELAEAAAAAATQPAEEPPIMRDPFDDEPNPELEPASVERPIPDGPSEPD